MWLNLIINSDYASVKLYCIIKPALMLFISSISGCCVFISSIIHTAAPHSSVCPQMNPVRICDNKSRVPLQLIRWWYNINHLWFTWPAASLSVPYWSTFIHYAHPRFDGLQLDFTCKFSRTALSAAIFKFTRFRVSPNSLYLFWFFLA